MQKTICTINVNKGTVVVNVGELNNIAMSFYDIDNNCEVFSVWLGICTIYIYPWIIKECKVRYILYAVEVSAPCQSRLKELYLYLKQHTNQQAHTLLPATRADGACRHISRMGIVRSHVISVINNTNALYLCNAIIILQTSQTCT